jgi:Sap, sulfolipid-1-addressing protein
VLGVVALCFAVAVWIGWLPRPRDETAPSFPTWMGRRLQDLSPSHAAAAGVLTHLPGLVYLAAMNAIVGDARGTLNGIVQVVVYNAIWFSLPIVALVLSVHRPTAARECLAQLASWARRHRRVIVVVFSGALGIYLLVAGVHAWPRPV